MSELKAIWAIRDFLCSLVNTRKNIFYLIIFQNRPGSPVASRTENINSTTDTDAQTLGLKNNVWIKHYQTLISKTEIFPDHPYTESEDPSSLVFEH